MLKDLALKNRSYRRFYEDFPVGRDVLLELVELARISSSAANKQSLRYFLSSGEKNEEIFECLAWAGYLTDWNGPEKGERPGAYIVVMNDKSVSANASVDLGLACQSILLGAAEKGLGGCMFGSINKVKLAEYLSPPENLEIVLVIAIGKPKETVVLEPIGEDGSIKYWRDEKQIHHVPKRSIEEIVIQ